MSFRINPYRKSVTPYLRPITPPDVDPDFNPVSVAVSCEWLSYIVGALSILTEQATWDTTDPDEMLLAIQRATNLIDIFAAAGADSACASIFVAFDCTFDFESGAHGWIVDPCCHDGELIAELGWHGTFQDSESREVVFIRYDFSPPAVITHFDASYTTGFGGMGPNEGLNIEADNGAGRALLTHVAIHPETGTASWDGYMDNVSTLWIDCNSGEIVANTYVFAANIQGAWPTDPCA